MYPWELIDTLPVQVLTPPIQHSGPLLEWATPRHHLLLVLPHLESAVILSAGTQPAQLPYTMPKPSWPHSAVPVAMQTCLKRTRWQPQWQQLKAVVQHLD